MTATYTRICALESEPESALVHAAEFLRAIGYEVVSSNARRIIMKYQGKFITFDDTESIHKLTISATNKQIIFKFSYWFAFDFSAPEKEVFNQRVEDALVGLSNID